MGLVVLFAGCGGGNGNVRPNEPQVVTPAPAVTISRAVEQGTTATDLIAVLKDHTSGGPWGPEGDTWTRHPQLPLWEGQPIVRVKAGTSPEHARMVEGAVDLINDWLPLEHRMIIGPVTTWDATVNPPIWRPDVPEGELHVSFDAERLGGRSHYNESGDITHTDDVPRMVSNWVEINANHAEQPGGHELFGVIVHEMIHALGLPGHVSSADYPDTIMGDRKNLPGEDTLTEIPRIEGEALMTAYVLYDDGETSDEINHASLGPWASVIPTLNGTVFTGGGNAQFGAEYRSQWIRVWDSGPVPTTTLAASALTGSATWTGEMVGYTGTGQEATGDAGITVALETLTGTAAFTDIMADGAAWGPDMSTAIAVTGNHFDATGDEPRLDVQGQFRGTGHEAATGVLRWEDTETGNLTGAFGAVR